MDYAVKLSSIVTGFSIDSKFIDCICGKKLIKIDKITGDIVLEKEFFNKEGFSRDLIATETQLIIRDFYTLYILNKADYSTIKVLQLGSDLKSDICGITFDKDNIYASIRNGSVAVINRKTFENNIYKIFDYSLWNLESYNDNLISGTTNGKLLIIDKNDMVIKNSIDIGKQNIGTIIIDKNSVYTAGQDKKLSKIDLKELKCKALRRNAHIRMFDCIGIYGNTVITISYPSSEIGFWDKETLDLIKTIKIPLSLTGRTFIENDCLYISSRNIQGIILFHL